jgi:hypothetical protein
VLDGLGIFAGLVAGFVMGLCSEIGYRLKIFKSSLAYIDGSFVARVTGNRLNRGQIYVIGSVLHLVTSSVFGGVFGGAMFLLGIRPSLLLLGFYVFLLWVAMLFSALPMAGQGLMGRKLGRFSWLEQLLLHIIYGVVFAWVMF